MISEASNAKMSKEDRITLWADVEQLETNLQEAIDLEDYSQAAVLRDRIKKLKLLDPYTSAKDKMDKAIAAEQYEEAARWKNSMAEVGEPPQKPGKGTSLSLSGDGTAPANSDGVSSSDITTLGVRVQASSFYVPEESSPADGRFLFGYNITITNVGSKTCQLVSRTWQIRTAPLGLTEEISGSGVVGRQPVLAPGEAFSYTSACPLAVDRGYLARLPAHRSLGSMEGTYLMVAGALGQEVFAVRVAPFGFILPADVPPP